VCEGRGGGVKRLGKLWGSKSKKDKDVGNFSGKAQMWCENTKDFTKAIMKLK
jgi:hypothetical protein